MKSISPKIHHLKPHLRGQAMLITVLALGGSILGVTTVAGILMLYQIRATTNSENSAAAIFAADAGVNWVLFDYYQNAAPLPEPPEPVFSNGALPPDVTCSNISNVQVACNDPTAVSAVSKGTSLNSRRAFFLDIADATGTLP